MRIRFVVDGFMVTAVKKLAWNTSPFKKRNHSFGVLMVSGNVWKTFKKAPWDTFPGRKKKSCSSGKSKNGTVKLVILKSHISLLWRLTAVWCG